jgi:hypothetical protein
MSKFRRDLETQVYTAFSFIAVKAAVTDIVAKAVALVGTVLLDNSASPESLYFARAPNPAEWWPAHDLLLSILDLDRT